VSCESYIVGDEARFTASFVAASNGSAIDPTTVVFKVKTPLGIETEFTYGVDAELLRLATGSYALDVLFTEPSLPAAPGATPPQPFPRDWFVRFISDGNLVSAKEQRIKVRPSNFAAPNPGGGGVLNAMTDDSEAMNDDGQPMTDTP
jgi:hypothetical protein